VTRQRCPGCGAEFAPTYAAYDRKFNASAECWTAFEAVIAVEFQSAALFGQVHQLTVDAYATQHAGGRHPDKSVCVHLVGLHLVIERGVKPPDVPARLQRLASDTTQWPHFEQPADAGAFTIQHVLEAHGESAEHARRVREWAAAVWESWRGEHERIRGLAKLLG
jgi:hypothetical protein